MKLRSITIAILGVLRSLGALGGILRRKALTTNESFLMERLHVGHLHSHFLFAAIPETSFIMIDALPYME
jgi:Na+-translocating ferredoxin:NAD+ oxidoreductase RnfE subunit